MDIFYYEGDTVTKSPKILILTGSYGNGHLKVSNTLREVFLKQDLNEVVESDLYLDSHPLLTKASQYLFIKMFSYGKKFYGILYYGGSRKKRLFKIDFMNSFGMKKLKQIVDYVKPDIIVNTFPMLVVPEFRKKTGIPIPIVNVVTDYTIHKNWIHNEIDKYYVASESVKQRIIENGIPSEKIKVTGIPIDSKFEEPYNKQALFKKYKLNPRDPVILISAGAYGVLRDLEEVVENLLLFNRYQIIIVCGKNEELKKSLTGNFLNEERVRIFGYTNKMDELMKMTTVMVTKPGGITLSESLALQVPTILYQEVPGQEQENALFFEKNGAAIRAKQPKDIIDNIARIIQNDVLRIDMIDNMKGLYHANSATVICEDVIMMLESERIKVNRIIV